MKKPHSFDGVLNWHVGTNYLEKYFVYNRSKRVNEKKTNVRRNSENISRAYCSIQQFLQIEQGAKQS